LAHKGGVTVGQAIHCRRQ